MKTSKIMLASALLLIISLGTAIAQQETASVTIIPNAKGEAPKEIIKTLENELQETKPVEVALAGLTHLPLRWKITQEQIDEISQGMEVQFVEVYTKSDDEIQDAIYDTKGNLVQVSGVVFNAPLPTSAKEIIDVKYNGWKVRADKEVFNTKDKRPDYFKVSISNGKSKRALYFDNNGNELNSHLKPTV